MKEPFDTVFKIPTFDEFDTYQRVVEKIPSMTSTVSFWVRFSVHSVHELNNNLILAILNNERKFYKEHVYLKQIHNYTKYFIKKMSEELDEITVNTNAEMYYTYSMDIHKRYYELVTNQSELYKDFKRWYKENKNKTEEGN